MQAFIHQHGGLIGSAFFILIGFNAAMTGLKRLCDALKIQEPGFLQKAGAVGSVLLEFMTANTTQKK